MITNDLENLVNKLDIGNSWNSTSNIEEKLVDTRSQYLPNETTMQTEPTQNMINEENSVVNSLQDMQRSTIKRQKKRRHPACITFAIRNKYLLIVTPNICNHQH